LRQEYQTIANAELKLGLDVNHYMGKCSPNNAKNNSQTFKLTPGHLEVLTVLTQTQKLQLLKELYLSLDDEGKVKCCNDIFNSKNKKHTICKNDMLYVYAKFCRNRMKIKEIEAS
jgi:hypothetical protein